MKGLDKIEAFVDSLPVFIPLAAEQNMQGAVIALMQDAEDTTLYENRSRATRASTLAYIAGSAGESGGVGAASGAGDALIEAWIADQGSGRSLDRMQIEQVDPEGPAGSTVVILTAFMAYDQFLFTMQNGARNALGEALDMNAVHLAEAGWAGIGELFS